MNKLAVVRFADDIFSCIFVNEKFCILIKISPWFVPKGPIDNNPSIGLDNGIAPNRQQAIIWTNVGTAVNTGKVWCILVHLAK